MITRALAAYPKHLWTKRRAVMALLFTFWFLRLGFDYQLIADAHPVT